MASFPCMDIVHVVTTLEQGGAERSLCDIVRRNSNNRHIVIKLFAGRDLFDDDVARASAGVYSLGLPRSLLAFLLLPFSLLWLLCLLIAFRPAIVVGWLYYGALTASLGRLLRLPVVWSLHAADFDLETSFRGTTRAAVRLCRSLSEHVPAVIHYCSYVSRVHHERLGFTVGKTVVIENGVDVDRFSKTAAAQTLTELAGLDAAIRPGIKLIGCIARFEQQKDHRTLLEAIAKLKADGRRFSVVLSGRDCHRDNPRLRALLEELDLHQEVIPIGVVADVARLIWHCDTVVLSSCEGEAMPMVLLEALSMGKPVVATDVGSARELVGPFGLVVPPRNCDALGQAIEQVVWGNPSFGTIVAERAPGHIRERYSLDSVVERWNNLFVRVAS